MKIQLSLILASLLFVTGANAQSESSEPKKWHYLADVYLMFPNMKGEVGVGNLPALSIDADESDILGKLKGGFMFYLEATNDDWAISSDFIYMKLNQGFDPGTFVENGSITMKETAWELAGLKKLAPWLEIGLGGRFVALELNNEVTTILESYNSEAKKSWFDPIFIVRNQGIIDDKWLLQLRSDIGGFGIGSDLSWQIQANAGYKFSELFQATIGYRLIDIDYEKGDGKEKFLYDVLTYGWVVHLGFNF